MSIKIEVYSDYVCPFCFFAKKTLDEIAQQEDIEIEWMPFELRPYPTPTLRPEDNYLPKVWKQSVYPMAEAMGVPIRLPSISPQPHTHLAFEGYQFAKIYSLGQRYNERMFKAFFQENRDIGNIEVLVELAEEIGLTASEFKQALIERQYQGIHQKALKKAYEELGITVVPSLVINGQVFSGMPRKDEILKAIDSLNK